jgi:hypothetical protein
MTRAMDESAPKQESKKEKQPKKEMKVGIPKKEMKVGIPKKESIIEFITEEELHSRNIDKNNRRCLNLVTVEKMGDTIRRHPSFEKDKSKYIAENRIYAVVSKGYFWDSWKVYGAGCHCNYVEDIKNFRM